MKTLLILVFSIIFLSGCATIETLQQQTAEAKRQEISYYEENRLKGEAWNAARARLLQYCQEPRLYDPCNRKLMKISADYFIRDWAPMVMPSYSTIVKFHEEEVRKRVTPRIYDEYLIAIGRYAAEQMDKGIISQEEGLDIIQYAFNLAGQAARQNRLLLRYNTLLAEEQEARFWQNLNSILVSLSQSISSYRQVYYQSYRPINCIASKVGNFINIDCF